METSQAPPSSDSRSLNPEMVKKFWKELDPDTQEHSLRVQKFAGLLGHHARLDPDLVSFVKEIALIHDIGKADKTIVPLLQKSRDQTTPEDIQALRQHSVLGARKIKQAGGSEWVAGVVKHHHEDNNGKGYPDGLTRVGLVDVVGEDGAIAIDILRISDSFDSMVNGHYALGKKDVDTAALEITRQMDEGRYNKDLKDSFSLLVGYVKMDPNNFLVQNPSD